MTPGGLPPRSVLIGGLRRGAMALSVGMALFLALGVAASPPALAHPLGNFTVNRYTGVLLSPGRVRVTYVLDMAEIPTFQAMPSIDTDGDGAAAPAERQAWADRQAPEILSRIALSVDGRPVPLAIRSDSMRFRSGQAGLPILYLSATYEGPVPGRGSLAYSDANWSGRIGWKEITARSTAGVAIVTSTVPRASVSGELTAYPVDLLSSPLDVRRASLTFSPGVAAAGAAGGKGPGPSGATATGAPVASGASFASLVRWRLTPLVLVLSLLLAFAFGAVHALGPGHGKTITAAYLVGSGARRRQALVVGGAISIMHMASVLVLGAVALVLSRSLPADRVYPWLTVATGAVALGLGSWLLAARLRARRTGTAHSHGHAHPSDGHHHPGEASAGHPHALPRTWGGSWSPPAPALDPRPGPPGLRAGRGLAALAVAGGILPSPTALVVLTGAIYAHRVWYGLVLIAAFSSGLAAALMGVGMLAIRARTAVSGRLGGRVGGLIPVASAAVIVGFGAFFALRGLGQVL